MFEKIITALLPFAVELVAGYIKSSESKKDDQVLKLVQDGCQYLADKGNNNVSNVDALAMKNRKVFTADELRGSSLR